MSKVKELDNLLKYSIKRKKELMQSENNIIVNNKKYLKYCVNEALNNIKEN